MKQVFPQMLVVFPTVGAVGKHENGPAGSAPTFSDVFKAYIY